MYDAIGTHLVRVTLEAATPLAIGSGETIIREIEEEVARVGEPNTKTERRAVAVGALVRDPDGLPTIPARSLRGVLRSLAARRHGERRVRSLLGWSAGDNDGQAGRVRFGWGRTHGADDACPPMGSKPDDALLRILRRETPLMRDHVAIDHRGIVDGRRKYMVASVPKGTRFSVQLSMRGAKEDWDPDGEFGLAQLVDLLADPELRLGRGGTRGYGAIDIVRASRLWLPLDREGIATLRRRLAEPPSRPFESGPLSPRSEGSVERHEILLAARGLVGIGGQGTPDHAFVSSGEAWTKVVDYAPPVETRLPDNAPRPMRLLVETVIEWPADKGHERRAFSLPGASLKGPLAHRTLYWWNKRNGRTVDPDALRTKEEREQAIADFKRRPLGLRALFGAIKDSGTDAGRAGAVAFRDDVFQATHVMRVDHVSIDRFTGGARDRSGALFAEELLFGTEASVQFTLRRPADVNANDWAGAITAFRAALDDLVQGRLPIGRRGWGRMDGTHTLMRDI